MPKLDDNLHLNMLGDARQLNQPDKDGIYGLHWGNPQTAQHLRKIRDQFLIPYVNADHVALEIGPGGGRWTRYLLSFDHLYVVDYFQELLEELLMKFRSPFMTAIKNNGTDFPGVADKCVDFVFSFGVFVHLDLDVIDDYLKNLRRVVKPSSNIVIQYSDKRKPVAQRQPQFSDNSPEVMRDLVKKHGYEILEEDTESLSQSCVIRFRP